MTSELTIGTLVKEAGVNIQTVRYYERRLLKQGEGVRPPSGQGLTPCEIDPLRNPKEVGLQWTILFKPSILSSPS